LREGEREGERERERQGERGGERDGGEGRKGERGNEFVRDRGWSWREKKGARRVGGRAGNKLKRILTKTKRLLYYSRDPQKG